MNASGSSPASTRSARVRHAPRPHVRVLDEGPHHLHLPRVLGGARGVRPQRVVGRVGPVGAVRIAHVEKHEEGRVAVRVQPGQQAVHLRAGRFLAARLRLRIRTRLVQLLETLVHVAELADEGDRGQAQRRVSRLPVHLGQRGGRAGQQVVERLHGGGGGIKRRHQRGAGGLGPRRLGHAVLEHGALGGHPRQPWSGRPLVAVERQVVPPQRVGPDEDHAPGRRVGRGRSRRRRRATHDRRAPEAERTWRLRRHGQQERDLRAGVAREIDPRRFPAMRRGDRALEQRGGLVAGARHVDAEGHRAFLHRPQGDVEPRLRREVQVEAQALGSAGGKGLPVHVGEPLPSQPGGHAREVLAPRHDAHRLDLERGPGGVGGPDQEVARGVGQDTRAAQDVRVRLAVRDQRRVQRPGDDREVRGLLREVHLLHGAERRRQVGSARGADADVDLVNGVAIGGRRARQHDDRAPGGGTGRPAGRRGRPGPRLRPRPGTPAPLIRRTATRTTGVAYPPRGLRRPRADTGRRDAPGPSPAPARGMPRTPPPARSRRRGGALDGLGTRRSAASSTRTSSR